MIASAFNTDTLDAIMCRSLLNVSWNGRLHDCDFNQVLGVSTMSNVPHHINDFGYAALARRKIAVDDHCYGCTAGQGST